MVRRLKGLLALTLAAALLLVSLPVAAQGSLDYQLGSIQARLTALEQRLAQPAPAAHVTAADAQSQILAYYNTVIAAKAMKSLAQTFEEPQGFWARAFGGDGAGIAGLVFLLLALSAIGTGGLSFAF